MNSMMINTENEIQKTNEPILSLKDQVSLDLSQKIEEFRNPRIGVRILSEKMGISKRTIKRLVEKESRPCFKTLYKIYCVIFTHL